MKKFWSAVVLAVMMAGVAYAEFLMVKEAEINFETQRGETLTEEIRLDLYVLKNAIIEGNSEAYQATLADLQNGLDEIGALRWARKNDEMLDGARHYVIFLQEKVDVVEDLAKLKEFSEQAVARIDADYTDANGANKETMAWITTEIGEIKAGLPEVKNEIAGEVKTQIGKVFDAVVISAEAVKNCIGVCYKDKMEGLLTDFRNQLKNTSSELEVLNTTIRDNVFDLDKLDELVQLTF